MDDEVRDVVDEGGDIALEGVVIRPEVLHGIVGGTDVMQEVANDLLADAFGRVLREVADADAAPPK